MQTPVRARRLFPSSVNQYFKKYVLRLSPRALIYLMKENPMLRVFSICIAIIVFMPSAALACACGCGVFDVGTVYMLTTGS